MVIFRKPVAGASAQSLARFVARARRAAGLRGRVVVLVTGSRELRDLNRRFRGKDMTTDVLSFPGAVTADGGGDIAISAEIAAANAARLGHQPAEELKVLILHGILHLAGYDHESDQGEMARLEVRLRRELRIPGTLIERAAGSGWKPAPGRAADRARRAARNAERRRT